MQKRSAVFLAVLAVVCFITGAVVRATRVPDVLETASPQMGSNWVADATGSPQIDLRPVETLYSVLRNLREYYVEPIQEKDEAAMSRSAVRSMIASLGDPNSRYLEPKERKLVSESQQGIFHGIGAITTVKRVNFGDTKEEHLIVLSVLEGSPSMTAGLKPGDDITAIDGRSILPLDPYARASAMVQAAQKKKTDRSVIRKELESEQTRIDRGVPIMEAQGLLSGYDEKNLELTISRKDAKTPLKFNIKPEKINVKPVEYSVPEGSKTALIKVNLLINATPSAFAQAMKEASQDDGLILDLRSVVGGDEAAAKNLSGYFMSDKRIGTRLQSRNRSIVLRASTIPQDQQWKKPLVVIVDKGTTQFAELVALALHDSAGAKLVGETTGGDSVYTTLVDLQDGSAFTMTSGKLMPLSGKDYTNKGVPVDIKIARGQTGDSQLTEALRVLKATAGGS